jgi:soluble lytic murein transglycosylase-like protein
VRSILAFGVLFFLFSLLGRSEEIYYYVDSEGVVHFSDTPKHSGYKPYKKTGKSIVLYGERKEETLRYQVLAKTVAEKYGIDPDLVDAIITVESEYNPFAISPRGAIGLMQLLPETANRFGVYDLFDPVENLHGGLRYLRYLFEIFDSHLPSILAAYHAGENRVMEHRGIPPIPSTQTYVKRVLHLYSTKQKGK